MENKEYFFKFEESLKKRLLDKAQTFGIAPSGGALVVDELDEIWKRDVPKFMQYAVKEFNSYPASTLAWAAYLGMAYANYWDSKPEFLSSDELFDDIVNTRGWDEMDEYISQYILALSSQDEAMLSKYLLSLAQDADTTLRRESVEAGTPSAFYALAAALKSMFELGVTLQLHALGYSYHKVEVPFS